MARFGWLHTAVACILMCISLASPVTAAEPVEVIVEGIEGDALENVRQALMPPAGLVREGKVDRLWLEHFERQAAGKVHSALEPFGYYNARVTTSIEIVDEESYRLLVRVGPGEAVRVTLVNVALSGPGAGEEILKELVASFPLRKGDILLQQRYEEAKGRLMSTAQGLGYLDAAFALHEIRVSKTESSARIQLILETGEQYRFNGVRFEGAPDYPERFLRRYLAFKPGDVFSHARLGETQLNLTNSERFREVIVTPEKEEARESQVPVLVSLNQAPRRRLRPGIGYGTDTGARFSLRYRDLNMLHLGHEFNVSLYVAESLQGLAAGYSVPSSKDVRSSTGVQLNLQRQDVITYVSRLVSLEVNRSRSFGAGRLGSAYVRFQEEDFTIGAQNASTRLVLPGLRLTENRYDDVIRPGRGHRYELELRGTHQLLGSDTGLLQFIAQGSSLVPLPWRLSFHTRARAGTSLLSDPLGDLPASLRFFAGGDQSVRGYSYQSLGPRDAGGKVVGGRHLLAASAELERALFKSWGVSLFYDAGNAFNEFSGVHIFQGAGAGVHYYSPVGALNLYLARQIGVADPAFHIHFTVGFEL